MPSLIRSLVAAGLVALPAVASAQTSQRVAQLQLGGAQIMMDATTDGHVSLLAVHNNLQATALLTLAQAQQWLDTALVISAAHDPQKRGVKWTYTASAPDLFLYRSVDSKGNDESIISIGRAVKVSLTIGHKDAQELLTDVAATARIAGELAASHGARCTLAVAVATTGDAKLTPVDSGALWLQRAGEQIAFRLATSGGTAGDAGLSVAFTVAEDGAVTDVRADSAQYPAVRALRDAIIYAGGWHAFKGIPGAKAVPVVAKLAPRCPK